MLDHQDVLLALLPINRNTFARADHPAFTEEVQYLFKTLSISGLASSYVDIGFFQAVLKFLIEQLWLAQKQDPKNPVPFKRFIRQFFEEELAPLSFLHQLLEESSLPLLKMMMEKSIIIEKVLLGMVEIKTHADQKEFATEVLAQIAELFEFEHSLQNSSRRNGAENGFSLYRTYDGLDGVFNLDYLADKGMKNDLTTTERLYEGAGVGVQSGYSTVLMALRYLAPARGSRFIDLGSGYGRLGMVIGLLRPDISFRGYEYVQHRVDVAMTCVENMRLQNHVGFYKQDLAARDFEIPDAEIYYLYDPFSEATYRHVLDQLMAVGERQKITIATKGNARGWLLEITQRFGWPAPREYYGGNLALFSSV